MPPKMLQYLMGHGDISITKNIYSALEINTFIDTVDKLDTFEFDFFTFFHIKLCNSTIIYVNMEGKEEGLSRPFYSMACFHVGESYVEGMWDYFSTLWQLAAGIKREPKKLYQGKPLQERELALWDEKGKENHDFREAVDREQKESGKLCYRYLDFPYGDGKTIDQVTGICGTMAKIVRCRGLGDDWEIPEYGDEAVILLSQALQTVGRRDRMTDWMEKRRGRAE